MRRTALGTMSNAQLNSRSSSAAINGSSRMGAKQMRSTTSSRAQPPIAEATNVSKLARSSLSRRSSSHGKGRQTITDPRPIADKGFQQDCIRSIVNYLTTHGYSNPISPKTLQAPSSKDVVSIIQFILLQADPCFEFKKIEEDVPMVFEGLGYPFKISRSALYAAGSPISWPSLLAAISWLVNLLKVLEPSDGGTPLSSRYSPFTEFVNGSYAHFLAGEDDECHAGLEEYKQQVREENLKYAAEVGEKRKEVNELKERLQKLKSEPSPLADIEAKKIDFQEDIGKFNLAISNFSSRKQLLEKKRDDKKQELARKKKEVVNICKENEELREKVAAQQVDAADVKRMLKEKQLLEENLQSVTNRKQELEKASWDYEIQASKKLRDLEDVVRQFNDTCGRLKLSCGEEVLDLSKFEIKLQPRADVPAEILGGDVKSVIKPAMLKLIQKTKKVVAEEINPEVKNLQEQLFKREIATREKLAQIAKTVANNKKLEAQLMATKGELAQILTSMAADREEIETRQGEEELSLKKEEAEVEHQLKEAQLDLETTIMLCNEEIKRAAMEGFDVFQVTMNITARTQATLEKLKETAAQSTQEQNFAASTTNGC